MWGAARLSACRSIDYGSFADLTPYRTGRIEEITSVFRQVLDGVVQRKIRSFGMELASPARSRQSRIFPCCRRLSLHWCFRLEEIASARAHIQFPVARRAYADVDFMVAGSRGVGWSIAERVLVADVRGSLPANVHHLDKRVWKVRFAARVGGKFLKNLRVLIRIVFIQQADGVRRGRVFLCLITRQGQGE